MIYKTLPVWPVPVPEFEIPPHTHTMTPSVSPLPAHTHLSSHDTSPIPLYVSVYIVILASIVYPITYIVWDMCTNRWR